MAATADGLTEVSSNMLASHRETDAVVGVPDPNGYAAAENVDLPQMLYALQAVRAGDFSVRLPGDRIGLAGKIADTFNEIVAANERMAQQFDYVGKMVG